MVSSRAKKGTRQVFTFFWCSNDFIKQKVYFSRLRRVYVGLIMLILSFLLITSFEIVLGLYDSDACASVTQKLKVFVCKLQTL